MIVIGHRGACMEALENSFQAFDLAIAQGATRLEFDVQLSKDSQAVVIHDEDLRRTAKRAGRVAEMTRDEILSVRLQNDEPIPFLDDVLARYSGEVELNIELKGTNPGIADAVARDLSQYQAYRQDFIISSFKFDPLFRAKQLMPDTKRACLWGPEVEWPEMSNFAPHVFMDRMETDIIHPWVGYCDRNLLEWAEKKNWTVYAYVDREAEDNDQKAEELWARLRGLGIDGLCTNWPEKLNKWLKKTDYYKDMFHDS